MSSQTELEEERRLCYVGITRAKQELYMSYAGSRMIFGNTQRNPVSRFVSEIPMEPLPREVLPPGRDCRTTHRPSPTGSRRPQAVTAPKWDDLATATPPAKPTPRRPTPKRCRLPSAKKSAMPPSATASSSASTVQTIVKVQFMGAVGMKKLDLGFAKLEKA